MKKREFDRLRQEHPNYFTKEDFYKLSHISKSTALYLLQSGKVPCKDTGKKTHRYLIPTENVIKYLEDREINPDKYAAEPGWYSGKVEPVKKSRLRRKRKNLTKTASEELKRQLGLKLEDFDDLFDVKDVCRLTGFSSTAVMRWCRSGELKAFMASGKYLIPKECFIAYMVTAFGTSEIMLTEEQQNV